jgi:hypothetical protein
MKEIVAFFLLYWWAPAGILWLFVLFCGTRLGAMAKRGDRQLGIDEEGNYRED